MWKIRKKVEKIEEEILKYFISINSENEPQKIIRQPVFRWHFLEETWLDQKRTWKL